MIDTDRLHLRAWQATDAAALAPIRSDPRVVVTLGTARDAPAAVIARHTACLAAHGFCLWAMTAREDGRLVGWCGLQPGFGPIAGATEIAWTLAPELWGIGLAREAAQAVLAWAWAETALDRIVAITTPGNGRSWGLMARLGMVRVPDGDFDHPALMQGDPLRGHVTYAIARPAQGRGNAADKDAMPADSRPLSAVARAATASSAG